MYANGKGILYHIHFFEEVDCLRLRSFTSGFDVYFLLRKYVSPAEFSKSTLMVAPPVMFLYCSWTLLNISEIVSALWWFHAFVQSSFSSINSRRIRKILNCWPHCEQCVYILTPDFERKNYWSRQYQLLP